LKRSHRPFDADSLPWNNNPVPAIISALPPHQIGPGIRHQGIVW